MKTLKWIVVLVIVVPVCGWFMFGDSFSSVVQTAVHRTRVDMKSVLGEDFKLSQAEMELDKADDDIAAQQMRVAELRVSVQEQTQEIEDLEGQIEAQKQSFEMLDSAWNRTADGTRQVSIRGQFTEPRIISSQRQMVATRLQKNLTAVDARKQLMSARTQALRQAEGHLIQIQQRRDRVEVALELSRVDLECVRLLQDSIGTDIEVSSLAAAEQITGEVAHNLRVQREATNLAYQHSASPQFIDQTPDETVARVRALIGKPRQKLALGE